MKYKKLVIGIDQSYTRSGISVAADNKLLMVNGTSYEGCKSPSDKRIHLSNIIAKLLTKAKNKASEVVILCERIRTFNAAQNKFKKSPFGGINPAYIKKTGALIATIVDTAAKFGVKVYSVDTRSWKAQIVGTSKAKVKNGKRDAKGDTVQFIQSKGFELVLKVKKVGKNKGEIVYDDDAADSACIALYGFLNKSKQKLVLEE